MEGEQEIHYYTIKLKKEKKIKYIDICSLYSLVCKYGKFPIGHSEVFVGHEKCSELDLKKIEGIIKCDILPPYDLFHPVLPVKQNNKLMFTLCLTCSSESNQDDCTHSEEQKTLTGTWVIDEEIKAIEKDYKIIQIHEIWSYKVQQYDKNLNKTGLFTEMMDKYLKIKHKKPQVGLKPTAKTKIHTRVF